MSKARKISKTVQALNLVANNRSITAKELSKQLKITMPYAYKLLSDAKAKYKQSPAGGMQDKPKTPMQAPQRDWAKECVIMEGGPTYAELTAPVSAIESALDIQVGGAHYKTMAIQPVTFIEANHLSFLEGSIVKRICRWRTKDGLKDLEKIKHEVDLLIELNNLK